MNENMEQAGNTEEDEIKRDLQEVWDDLFDGNYDEAQEVCHRLCERYKEEKKACSVCAYEHDENDIEKFFSSDKKEDNNLVKCVFAKVKSGYPFCLACFLIGCEKAKDVYVRHHNN